jgi:hypothetical protein
VYVSYFGFVAVKLPIPPDQQIHVEKFHFFLSCLTLMKETNTQHPGTRTQNPFSVLLPAVLRVLLIKYSSETRNPLPENRNPRPAIPTLSTI